MEINARATPEASEIKIKANGGSRMSFPDRDVVIDLSGIIATHNDKAIPLLYNHDKKAPIGYAAKIEVKPEDGIFLTGKLTIDNECTNNIRDSWREGQPWEASLGFLIVEAEEVPEGAVVEVNGRQEVGPVTIARAVEVMECSVVTFGADSDTYILKASEKDTGTVYVFKASATFNILNNKADDLTPPAIDVSRGKAMMEEENKLNNTRIASLACLMRAGVSVKAENYKEAELEAANQIKGLDFRSIIEASTGWTPTHAERSNCGEWLRAAASSFGLNQILQTVSSEMLLRFVDNENELWRKVFKVTSCADTRPSYRFKENGSFELKKNIPGMEMEHAVYSDEKAVISADLYTKQFSITEEEILAGNALGAMEDLLRQAAAGSARTVKSVLWGKFLNPGNSQFDGQAFFSSSRGNATASSALTYDNLAAAIGSFHQINGRGILPSILLVPASLWATAQTLCKATSFYDGGSGANINPITTAGLTPVCVPDLELEALGGAYSSTTWYLLADPAQIPAFEATFVGGTSTPRLRRQDINIGFAGIKFDCTLGFGCAAIDPTGISKYTA